MKISHVAVALLLSGSLSAQAENKLFPTDILDQGGVDVNFSAAHNTESRSITSNGSTGKASFSTDSESAAIRYGLVKDLHVGLGLNYLSRSSTTTDYVSPQQHYNTTVSNQTQNPSLWARYGFINQKDNPLSVSGSLLVLPNTTGRQAAIYQGALTVGWVANKNLRLFGDIFASASSDPAIANATGVTVGAYQKITERVTLIPVIGFSQYQSSSTWSSTSQQNYGLTAQVEVLKTTYVSAGATFRHNAAYSRANGSLQMDPTSDGLLLQASLYHLF